MFEGRTRFTGTPVRRPEMKLALARWIHAVTRKAKLREPNRDRTRAFIGGISLALALSAGVLGAPTAHAAPCIETPVASGTGAATIYTVTFTTVGACDWTAPAGVVSIDVLLVSGGGGGGGGYSDGGGGGGAGAEAKVVAGIGVVSGSSYTVTVGDGGLGGGVYPTPLPGSADNGASGGMSSFHTQSANGGGGGSPGGVTTGRGGNGGDRGASGGTTTESSGGGGAGMSGAGSAATSGSGGSGSAGAVAASISGLFSGWADVYGGGGGGGAGTGAGAAGAGGSGGGASGGVGVDGLSGTSNTGGGGGGGGDGRPGGQGGSGIVVIKYQVASISPSTLTVNATVGQAITPTTFVLYGVGATALNQWCESTPGTYDGTSAYELVPGITLDENTCVLSGTPSAAASTAAFVIGGGGSATVPAGGRSTVTLTVSAGGGGSGGGGGSSSTPEPTPEPTPTPTPAPTPSSVATTPPVVEPIPPGSNPNIPTSGVPLGASVYLVNGEPQTVVVRPDAPKDATAIDVVGDGFTMKLAGLGGNGQPLGVTSDGALILQSDRTAAVEGTGFLPNSDVNLYTFSTPRFLGTVKTDASGNFKGTVPLPTDIPAGRHTLQSNGLAPDGAVRSLSLGVLLTADKARVKARTAKATVYFNALSPELTSSAKASLKSLAKGRAASATRTLVVGYVQDSGLASNNQTLSAQRAKTIAAYLRSLGLKGTVVTQGDGVAKESGAAGRKAEVTIRYRR